jgi:amino acid transporter
MSTDTPEHIHNRRSVECENVGDEYLRRRQLRRETAGPVLLIGLGVGSVVAGDYAGWNFGLSQAGWGGMLVAVGLMGLMYTAMGFALAEMSSIIPTAGGGHGFARRALGPWGGFLTGTAVLLKFVLAPAAVVTFIGAYVESLLGISGPVVYAVFYIAFIGLHLYGVTQVLKLMFGIAIVAVVGLLVFSIGMIPHFDASNLLDIAPTEAVGASWFLPIGLEGVWAALPYATWFFLLISVFGATISYILMMLSHIVLRIREPELHRPYRTPGGIATSATALALALAALSAGFLVDPTVAACAVMIAYFTLYSRHHLVAKAPEEEFQTLQDAESELGH